MIYLFIGVAGFLGPYSSGRLLADRSNIIDTGLVRYAAVAFHVIGKGVCHAR